MAEDVRVDIGADFTGDASGVQKASKDASKALNDYEKSVQSLNKEVADILARTQSGRDNKFLSDIKLLDKAFNDGAISAGQYKEAVALLGGEFKRASDRAEQLGIAGVAIGASIGQFATDAIRRAVQASVELVGTSIENQEAFYKLSKATGVSTEALSGWADGAAREKITVSELSTGMRNLARNFAEAQGGRGDGGRLFKALDIDVNNFRTIEELMPVVAQRISELREGANKTDLVRLLIGQNPEKWTAFFADGAQGLENMRQAAREAGNEINGGTARAAAELNNQMDDLRAHVRGLGNDVATFAVPKLNEMFARIKEGRVIVSSFGDAWKEVLRIMGSINPAFRTALELLEKGQEARKKAATESNKDARDYFNEDPDRGKRDAPAIGTKGLTEAERAAQQLQRDVDKLMAGTETGRASKLNDDIETLSKGLRAGLITANERAEAEIRLRDAFEKSSPEYKRAMEEEAALRKSRADSEKQFDQMIEARDKAELAMDERGAQEEIAAAKNMEKITKEVNEEGTKKAKEHKDALDKLISPTLLGRAKELKENIDLLNAAFAHGEITSEEYNQALNRVTKEFDELGKTGKETAKEIVDAIEGTGRKTSRALAEMAVDGTTSFKTLLAAAKEFATELLDILIYKNAIKPAVDYIGGAANSFFTGGSGQVYGKGMSPQPDGFGLYAGTGHTGAVIGVEHESNRVVPMDTYRNARRHHTGTVLGADEVPFIGKKKEGVFTPAQMKALAPAGSGGPQSIRVEVINQGTPQQVQSAKPSFDADGMVIRIVTQDIKNGGQIAQGMQGAYGLRRTGG